MFIDTIIVTGNGTGANVNLRAYITITNIAQMIDLAARAYARFLGLNKVANAGTFTQYSPWAQPSIGSNTTVFTNDGLLQMTHGMNHRAVRHTDVRQHAMCAH